jgi:hypothetical protein
MRGLALYAGFVVFSTVCAVLIGKSIESYTSPDIGSIVMLVVFFVGLVVSWIATVLVMDGSLKNFRPRKSSSKRKRRAGNTWPGTCRFGTTTQAPTRPADDAPNVLAYPVLSGGMP